MRLIRHLPCTLSALFLVSIAGPAFTEEPFALKPNDKVVFYGDSITDQRLYTMVTELFIVTRYPKLGATFVDSGWGGDRVSGGGGGPIETRLSRDVIAYHPTVMTIMLGMNDGKYVDHTDADDTAYYAGYRDIIESVRRSIPNLRITVIGPSPFDDVTRPVTLQPNGYNAVMVKYSEFLKKYAQEAHLSYADLNTGVVQMLQKANGANPEVAQKIIPDRVHPALAGHLIMAEQLLKSWHARPVVSSVVIDASAGKVGRCDFATVTDLHPGATMTWTETEDALPLPFANMLVSDRDKTLDLAIRSSDVTAALNQEPLQVTGLPAGKYALSIDRIFVGTFSSSELGAGVNLATLGTPMSDQAINVFYLTVKRLDVHQARWRIVQVPLTGLAVPHAGDAMKALDEVEAEVTVQQRQTAQPVPHHFQLALAQ